MKKFLSLLGCLALLSSCSIKSSGGVGIDIDEESVDEQEDQDQGPDAAESEDTVEDAGGTGAEASMGVKVESNTSSRYAW